MSTDEIELLKMQIQRDVQEQQAQERREQRRIQLFMWFVAFVWPLVVNVTTSLIEQQTAITQAAVVKSEVVAAKVETDKVLSDIGEKLDVGVAAAVSTNAINTDWLAKKTGDPEDEAKAQAAKERLDRMP